MNNLTRALYQKICKHTETVFLENVYGDRINHYGCRSLYECTECQKIIKNSKLFKESNTGV